MYRIYRDSIDMLRDCVVQCHVFMVALCSLHVLDITRNVAQTTLQESGVESCISV